MTVAYKVTQKADIGNNKVMVTLTGSSGQPNIAVQIDVEEETKWLLGSTVTATFQV